MVIDRQTDKQTDKKTKRQNDFRNPAAHACQGLIKVPRCKMLGVLSAFCADDLFAHKLSALMLTALYLFLLLALVKMTSCCKFNVSKWPSLPGEERAITQQSKRFSEICKLNTF